MVSSETPKPTTSSATTTRPSRPSLARISSLRSAANMTVPVIAGTCRVLRVLLSGSRVHLICRPGQRARASFPHAVSSCRLVRNGSPMLSSVSDSPKHRGHGRRPPPCPAMCRGHVILVEFACDSGQALAGGGAGENPDDELRSHCAGPPRCGGPGSSGGSRYAPPATRPELRWRRVGGALFDLEPEGVGHLLEAIQACARVQRCFVRRG